MTNILLIVIILILLAIFGRIDRAISERSNKDAGKNA